MADNKLNKLFVIVKTAQHDSFYNKYVKDVTGRDESYDNKIVFLEKTQEIFTKGKLYGGGADLAALKTILADYGENGKRATTVAGDIDALLAKLSESNILSLAYNTATGQYDVNSYLGLTTNATSYALELTGYNGVKLGTSVDVAANNAAFVEANNAYLTNVKGVTDYVTTQIGQLSGGMRYNGNIYTTTQTVGETTYTIGYFPWNAATQSMKPGDTAIADVDFDVLNSSNEVVKHVEAGDILIGKYTYPIEKQEGDDEHGIKLTADTLEYVTIIERETDTMVTASTVFGNANKVILSNTDGRDVKASEMGVGADANTEFTTANTLATEVAVAAYVNSKVSSTVEALDVTAYQLKNDYVAISYSQTDGIVNVHDLTTYVTTVSYANGALTIGDTNGVLTKDAATAINSYIAYVGGIVDKLDESYTTVSTAADPTGTYFIKVQDNSEGNDHNYVVTAYTMALGDAVGMYKMYALISDPTTEITPEAWAALTDEQKALYTPVWHNAAGTLTTDALTTASDVAKEIVADEKVIAAALNQHETRIKACEAAKPADGDASDVRTGIYAYAYTVAGTIKGVTVNTWNAGLTYTNGDITVTNATYFMNGDNDLNQIKAYAVAQGDAAKAASAAAIEALDVAYAAGSDFAVNVSYQQIDGKISYVSATFAADKAIAYTVGTGESAVSYSVADVAAVVYDPWETFA